MRRQDRAQRTSESSETTPGGYSNPRLISADASKCLEALVERIPAPLSFASSTRHRRPFDSVSEARETRTKYTNHFPRPTANYHTSLSFRQAQAPHSRRLARHLSLPLPHPPDSPRSSIGARTPIQSAWSTSAPSTSPRRLSRPSDGWPTLHSRSRRSLNSLSLNLQRQRYYGQGGSRCFLWGGRL